MIHTVNNGVIYVLPGRGNDDFLRAGRQVCAGCFTAAKESGALVDHVHTQLGPGQFGRVAFREDLYPVAVDDQIATIDTDLAGKTAVRSIVLRQVRIGRRICQVVDGHNANFIVTA